MLRFAWCATQALQMIRARIKHRQDPSINKNNTHEGYHARFEKLVTHWLNLYQKQVPFKSGHPATARKIIMCVKIMHRSLLTLRILGDFQSSYRTDTICHHRSLLVSIQAFNGGFSRSILPIRTHETYSSGKVVAK